MGVYDYYSSFCVCPPRRIYLGMRTRTGVETSSFPVTGYDVTVSLMGTAADKAAYIALWNADPNNQVIGTLYGAAGPFLFLLLLTNGQTPPPWVIGDPSGSVSNIPPTAYAGADQSITLPTSTVTLTGIGIDIDGTIASYLWTKVSGPAGGAITSPSTAATGITGLGAGTYVYMLTVTDNLGATGTDTVSIIVGAAPFAFTVHPASQTVATGATVTLTATVTGGTPNYTPRWYKNGALFLTQAAQSSTSFSATFTPADGDVFYLTVTDSLGNLITSNNATITVTAPSITATFGYSLTDPWINDTTVITISNPATATIAHNANLTHIFPTGAQDTYIEVKYPDTESVKTAFDNGTNPLVNGVIPGGEFRFFTTGGFHWIIARVPRSFDASQPLNFTS